MKKLLTILFSLSAFSFLNAQDSTLNEYVGMYLFPEGSVVTSVEIKIENGGLMANSSQGSSALEKISKDTFNLVAYNGLVSFHRDGESKIDSIRIEVQDVILEGRKDTSAAASLSVIEIKRDYSECLNEKSRSSSFVRSFCSPVTIFFNLYEPVFISSSPMITTKGMPFFSAYLNCLSNFTPDLG